MADQATLRCQWLECTETFADAEQLFSHLCDQHVGRKSSGNLSLTCYWQGCNTTCSKRDHITSHMRVHTPLKPHACGTCGKAFKRPQDLRKHEKIHTEEHHARHKQSKAITVPSISHAKPIGSSAATSTLNGQQQLPSNAANGYNQLQQHHARSVQGLSQLMSSHHQQPQMLKQPNGLSNGIEVSPGPVSTLNPNTVGNTSSSHAHAHAHPHPSNGHSSVSPPGTAGGPGQGAPNTASPYFPFMLPYPYAAGYGLPTPEQQAGLAELLLQQQRLNAAAAQLIGGMPPSQLSQGNNATLNGQADGMQQQNNQQQYQGVGAANGPGGIPPYSLLFPGLLGGFQNGAQQQLYQNYQQQYGQFGGVAASQQQQQQMQPSQHVSQQHQKSAGGLYPDLDDLMKNENMPPLPSSAMQQDNNNNRGYTSSASTNTSYGGRSSGYSSNGTHHTRSDSSNGASPVSSHHFHSVSPQPPAYIPSRHHPDYSASHNHHQQQQHYPYNNGSASHLFQKQHQQQSNAVGAGNTVLGKGKRSFESEADSLLNDLKKKRYDGNNGSQFEQRLDSLSSYLFDSDPTFSEAYSTSLPSVTVDSTQSPSDRSSHSSTSNFSPRSTSGSVKSPAEIALDLSKSDIDDINNLLFSFGQPYETSSSSALSSPHSTMDISSAKNPSITWPVGGGGLNPQNHGLVNADFAATAANLPTLSSNNGHPSSGYVDFVAADTSKASSNSSTISNATITQSNNTHIYPSLSGLSPNKSSKSITHSSSIHGNYLQQNQPLSLPLHQIAPARSIPTPYIASDIAREPQMTTIPLLSRAPPADRLPPLLLSRNRIPEEGSNTESGEDDAVHRHKHSKSGVSSLRSTMHEDDAIFGDTPRTEEEEAALSLQRMLNRRTVSPPRRSVSIDEVSEVTEAEEDDEERITLPPIGQPDHRGSECHLPSLRSLLANDPNERYEPRYRTTEFISSPPSTATSSSLSYSHSHQSHAQKRATPSRQFYPSLASLAMRDEPASYASTSTSSTSTEYNNPVHSSSSSYHYGTARPSTGDKLDRITRGVGTFRMDSYDEENDDGTKSESDDDMSPDAIYKRSRQRTRGPTPPHSAGESPQMNNYPARMVRSPSAMSEEDDELASDHEEENEDVKPTIVRPQEQEQITHEQLIYRKRLAVIHALVARANALYREQMARKRHYPALVRVKEEEFE